MAVQWTVSWGPPICGCLFKGQVLLGGSVHTAEATFPSDSRIIRWSEIGAFKFLGANATANRNEAGEMFVSESSDECVLALVPMKKAVVAFSTMSVTLLKPVSQPVPAYEIDYFLSRIGILNPLAVNGSDKHLVYVDKMGTLKEIFINQYGQYEDKKIGYSHIFAPMQENFNISIGFGLIVVTYNPDENEWYISNGIRSFVYNLAGLTEIGVAVNSYVNLKSTFISAELFSTIDSDTLGCVTALKNSEYIYLESEPFNFGLSALKTIKQVEVEGEFAEGANISVMIKWANAKSYNSTIWKRCSPTGVCSPVVSGSSFRVCIMISPVENAVITGLTVEWQLSDKSSVRGNYAGNNAT